MANGNTKPIKKFQAGGLSAAVWKNPVKLGNGSDGNMLSVTLDRRYKDNQGEWQSSSSYRLNDLPKAVLVLTQAYAFVATAGDKDVDADDDGDRE